MFRSRLAIKIGLLIVIVLIIGSGASTIVTTRRESDALIDRSKRAARRLTTAVVASIEGAMLQERPDVTRRMIQELKSSSLVEGFTIYRRNGVEAFTDLATAGDVARRAGLAPEVLANISKMQRAPGAPMSGPRSEEHTSELQSQSNLVCRLLLEKKKNPHVPSGHQQTGEHIWQGDHPGRSRTCRRSGDGWRIRRN